MKKDISKYKDYLIDWLKEKLQKSGAEGFVVGLSGGIDSAVVASLVKLASQENNKYTCVFLNCDNQPLDYACVNEIVYRFALNFKQFDLTDTFNNLTKELAFDYSEKTKNFLVSGNLKARLRMSTLYAYANYKNYLVIGTSNKSEWHLGYFTKFGDGAADLYPIINLLKSEVVELAKVLNIPSIIIDREPTASLYDKQTDEKEMGLKYVEIDAYLSNDKVNALTQKKIEKRHNINKHKRFEVNAFPDEFK